MHLFDNLLLVFDDEAFDRSIRSNLYDQHFVVRLRLIICYILFKDGKEEIRKEGSVLSVHRMDDHKLLKQAALTSFQAM